VVEPPPAVETDPSVAREPEAVQLGLF
jgi:hypothetical protein